MNKRRGLFLLPGIVGLLLWITGTTSLSANNVSPGINYYVYDNFSGQFNSYNASPPIPPITPVVASGTTAAINHQWGSGFIFGTNLYDDVVVQFVGYLKPDEPGQYILCGQSDDGFLLNLEGQTVINDWYDRGGGCSQVAFIDFGNGNSKSIEAWWYENGGGAFARLMFLDQFGQWQSVPNSWYSLIPIQATTTTTTSTTTTEPAPTSTTQPFAEESTSSSSSSSSTSSSVESTVPKPVEEESTTSSSSSSSVPPLTTTTIQERTPPTGTTVAETTEPIFQPDQEEQPSTTLETPERPRTAETLPDEEGQISDTTNNIDTAISAPSDQDDIETVAPENPIDNVDGNLNNKQIEEVLSQNQDPDLLSEDEKERISDLVDDAIESGVDEELAAELAASQVVLASINASQASEIFSSIDESGLSQESADAIVDAVQAASNEIRSVFEDVVELFSGVFDSYKMLGSTITVGQRRTVVAVAALTVAVGSAPIGSSGSQFSSTGTNDAARKEEDDQESSGEIAGDGLQWVQKISIFKIVDGVKVLDWKQFFKKFGYGVMNLGFTLAGSLVVYLTLSGPIQIIAGVSTLAAFVASMWLHMKEPDDNN